MPATASTARPVVLYDGHCAFCRRSVALLARWDRGGKIDSIAMQQRHAHPGLPPLDDAALAGAMHVVTPAGTVHAGADAVRVLLRWLPFGTPLALLWRVPGVPWVAERVYRWVARHRYRLVACDGGAACGVGAAGGRGAGGSAAG